MSPACPLLVKPEEQRSGEKPADRYQYKPITVGLTCREAATSSRVVDTWCSRQRKPLHLHETGQLQPWLGPGSVVNINALRRAVTLLVASVTLT